jgi:Txe/YoeB family toxin of Txe-Axe toxin-antitoxin module
MNLHELFFFFKKLTNNISNAYSRRITGNKTSESLHIQVKSRY